MNLADPLAFAAIAAALGVDVTNPVNISALDSAWFQYAHDPSLPPQQQINRVRAVLSTYNLLPY